MDGPGAPGAQTQEGLEPPVAAGSSADTAGTAGTAGAAGTAGTTTPPSLEPLACVTCRSRKLKCDRLKPSCTRCAKNPEGGPCVYPESRRKPVFKRRNVKDLEARLAQVEDLLVAGAVERKRAADTFDTNLLFTHDKSTIVPFAWGSDPHDVQPSDEEADHTGPGAAAGNSSSQELIGLGLTESTPPFEVIEDLHDIYFEFQQTYVPIVHPARYLKAFHSAPHLRPPMGLQYVMWALASQGHPRYNHCHDIFYRRARQYLEADEMRGHGEHFITVAHAQAWALVTTYEARRMFFTRAAMSCARCVRLVGIMGLNHLDDDETAPPKSAPTLLPAKDWTELEERRRVFWSAFCVDSHASISTGWPSLINPEDITTLMPASEEAFQQGIEEPSTRLDDAFSGSTYSTFSSSIIICHIFNSILRHVQSKRNDRPEDFKNGPFWQRHRDLDTMLSSSFVFLPERYRLPHNLREPVAVHANLNLHAATICLHNAALDRATANNLPEVIKKDCQSRLLIAAQEIVNIMKLTSHMATNYKTPLASLSLYCSASVFIHQAVMDEQRLQQQTQQPADESSPESAEDISMVDSTNLEFIFKCMDSLARNNNITVMFMQQAVLDMHRNGLATSGHHAWFEKFNHQPARGGHYIPVLAMSAVSKHSDLQSPLPGRLPLVSVGIGLSCVSGPQTGAQARTSRKPKVPGSGQARLSQEARAAEMNKTQESGDKNNNNNNKRRRMQSPNLASENNLTTTTTTSATESAASPTFVLPHRVATTAATATTTSSAAPTFPTAAAAAPTAAATSQRCMSVDATAMPFLLPNESSAGAIFGLGGTQPLPVTHADHQQPHQPRQQHQPPLQDQPIGGNQPLSADLFASINIVDPWEMTAPPGVLGGGSGGVGGAADPTATATAATTLADSSFLDLYGGDTSLLLDASFMYAQLFGVARASGFNVPPSAAAPQQNSDDDPANDPWALLDSNEFEQ